MYTYIILFKGRSRQLRPKAHILDDPLGNPYDVLKVLLATLWLLGPYKVPLWPYITPEKRAILIPKKEASYS